MKKETYISVDIEASGPIPGEFSMLSLGACIVGDTKSNFYVEIKPITDRYVQSALDVCGLSFTDLQNTGVEPGGAMKNFEAWINKVSEDTRPVFVGFNATFDWMFVHYYFTRFLGRNPFGKSGLDIKAYYMGLTSSTWGDTTKKAVTKRFPSKRKHTHNALDDAIEQAEIFDQMLEKKRQEERLEEMLLEGINSGRGVEFGTKEWNEWKKKILSRLQKKK